MTQDDRMETNPTRANGGPVRGDAPLVSGECPYPAVMATRYPDRAIGTVAGVTIIESHDPQASTYAEHMETITDRAEIRDSDEPDPFRRNPVAQTGPDDPWRFTRFVADDHECVIVRDEYDEPAPFGSCSTHRRALSSPVALGCTTSARVGAAVALDLDALHETICDKFTGMAEVRQAADLLVAEVRRLRQDIDECWVPLYHDTKHERDQATARAEAAEAEVVTLRARLAAVEETLHDADATSEFLAASGDTHDAAMAGAVFAVTDNVRAALATTGEGE